MSPAPRSHEQEPLAKHADWRSGYRIGFSGQEWPKTPKKQAPVKRSEQFKQGFEYGRHGYALDQWCRKHNRSGVYSGPFPGDDPPPDSYQAAERWLKENGK